MTASLKQIINTTTILTDGGLETDLIFNKKINLPHFAAFVLLDKPSYTTTLKSYYYDYLDIAKKNKMGFILESPTWRANKDWGYTLGYNENDLIEVNQKAISLLEGIKAKYKNDIKTILISGQIGPRHDAYEANKIMSVQTAKTYHSLQVDAFKKAGADLTTALTMTNIPEALGITQAAMTSNIPVVISFTVETHGSLPSGESLSKAINKIDSETNSYPLYYMINCAHPSHFFNQILIDSEWKYRIQGIRANASCKSHAELDEATSLDRGDALELGRWYSKIKRHLPKLSVYGGCCGTDTAHIASICRHIK
ncbi:MAG: homocysteine S-methyltransferase family protein [Bacteroidota bacterium]